MGLFRSFFEGVERSLEGPGELSEWWAEPDGGETVVTGALEYGFDAVGTAIAGPLFTAADRAAGIDPNEPVPGRGSGGGEAPPGDGAGGGEEGQPANASDSVYGVNWWEEPDYTYTESTVQVEPAPAPSEVDWDALGSAWEGAAADSAAENAAVESSVDWGGVLQGVADIGARALGELGSSLFRRSGAAPATRPASAAPRLFGNGEQRPGGALGLTSSQSRLVTLGLVVLGVVLVVNLLAKGK